MALSLTVLASGSSGNSTVLTTSRTRLLIDCGLSCRESCRRLAVAGIEPETLSAILITHEHSDHVNGVHVMAKKFRLPVYMTAPAHAAWQRIFKDSAGNRVEAARLEIFSPGHGFCVGDIDVTPFPIPHDAVDPVGFRFLAEGIRVAIATDLGFMPPNVRDQLRAKSRQMLATRTDANGFPLRPRPPAPPAPTAAGELAAARAEAARLRGVTTCSPSLRPAAGTGRPARSTSSAPWGASRWDSCASWTGCAIGHA